MNKQNIRTIKSIKNLFLINYPPKKIKEIPVRQMYNTK
jgi:hypothetical protein